MKLEVEVFKKTKHYQVLAINGSDVERQQRKCWKEKNQRIWKRRNDFIDVLLKKLHGSWSTNNWY